MSATASSPTRGPASFLTALTGRRVLIALVAAVAVAVLLNPIFVTPFAVLLGRTLFIAMVLLLVFVAASRWPRSALPEWLPRWVVQIGAVALAAPAATLAVYALSVGGDLAQLLQHEGLFMGFVLIASSGLVLGLSFAFGALYRERDAQARSEALAFQLEKSNLERQALDARLALLRSQIEPHFLFNTLANVQALVESGSPRAAPVLASLIAYLRAAMPRLASERATLADEIGLVRAYLELMRMRMPDRLDFAIDVEPPLEAIEFPPMALLTLVENAVRHGIDPSEDGGRIELTARREGPRVRVRVADGGVGLDAHAEPGTGLANLRERLAVFFGPDAGLELSARVPRGVQADIVFTPR